MATVSLEGYSQEQINNLAALSVKLSNDPKAAREFHRVIRQVEPDFVSPLLDSDARVEEATRPLKETVSKLEERLQREAAEKRLNELYDRAVAEGVNRKEIDDGSFVKWAETEGFSIAQLDKAARYRNVMNQQAVPTAPEYGLRPAGFTEEDATEMKKNPMKWFEKSTHAAVADVLKARRSPA